MLALHQLLVCIPFFSFLFFSFFFYFLFFFFFFFLFFFFFIYVFFVPLELNEVMSHPHNKERKTLIHNHDGKTLYII